MKSHQQRFLVLDGMRGIAALLVVLYHFYRPMQLPFLRNCYFAVDFFFVLSGFVICHSYGSKLRAGMPFHDYIAKRIARLLPMMALGLCIGLPAVYFYIDAGKSGFTVRELTASALANFFFLPYFNDKQWTAGIVGSEGVLFPADPPLWSIFFEMIASLAFLFLIRLKPRALLAILASALTVLVVRLLLEAFSAGSTSLTPDDGWGAPTFLGGFPRVIFGFVLGMLIYEWRSATARGALLDRVYALRSPGPLVLYAALVAVLTFPLGFHGLYYLATITVFSPLIVLLGGASVCRGAIVQKVSHFLGWISFPIYCLHKPVLTAVEDVVLRSPTLLPASVPVPMVALGLTLITSIVGALAIDRYMQRFIGELLEKKSRSFFQYEAS